MTAPNSNDDRWLDCPPGTLTKLSPPQRVSTRRLSPFSTGLVVGITACLLFAAFSVFFSGGESDQIDPVGLLTCAEVRPLLVDYQAGELDGAVSKQVQHHLANCEECRMELAQLAGQPSIGNYWADHLIPPQRLAVLLAQR